MGCGTKLASILLFVFTATFLLVGLALAGAGVWMLVSQDKLFNLLNLINQEAGNNEEISNELDRISEQKGVVATAGAILVAVGGISALISIFGCCGVIKQSKCLLSIYAGTIAVLLGGQIAAGVLVFLYKNTAVSAAKNQLVTLQNKYLISVNEFLAGQRQPHSAISLLYNYMFVSLRCCGVNSTADSALSTTWLSSNRDWLNRGNMTVPATCCPVQEDARTPLLAHSRWSLLGEFMQNSNCPIDQVGMYDTPCVDALLNFVNQYSLWIIVGCGAFAGAQLLVVLFTVCLICAISDGKYK